MDQVENKIIEDKWEHLTQPEMYSEYIDYLYDTSKLYSRDGEHQIKKILSIELCENTLHDNSIDAHFFDETETDPEYIQAKGCFLSANLQEKNLGSNDHKIRVGVCRDLPDYIKWLRGRLITLI